MSASSLSLSTHSLSLLLALGGTLCFSISSLVYADYAKRVSVLWMNCFKALVCFIALAVTIPLFVGWHQISASSLGGFLLSGLLGLNIGDLFLLTAYTKLGVARTLIVFGFQPLFIGTAAYFALGQPLDPTRFFAVIFLIACLVTFSLERYKLEKRWEVSGFAYAMAGMLLDGIGVLLTRFSFAGSPAVTPLEGCLWRALGALAGFAVIARFRPIPLLQKLREWPAKSRAMVTLAAFGGTYLSLSMYLTAVKNGHLASVSSVAITGPMFAAALECLAHRKPPSRYLLTAFAFFCIGYYILLRGP